MKTDIVVIVQCRLSSTRFPEKAIKDLGGKMSKTIPELPDDIEE